MTTTTKQRSFSRLIINLRDRDDDDRDYWFSCWVIISWSAIIMRQDESLPDFYTPGCTNLILLLFYRMQAWKPTILLIMKNKNSSVVHIKRMIIVVWLFLLPKIWYMNIAQLSVYIHIYIFIYLYLYRRRDLFKSNMLNVFSAWVCHNMTTKNHHYH